MAPSEPDGEASQRDSQHSRRSVLGAIGGGLLTPTTQRSFWTQPPTEIDSCTTITEPGEYVLTKDITPTSLPAGSDDDGVRSCIRIASNDVVIDGNGCTLDTRAAGGGVAIYKSYRGPGAAAEIRNLTIRGGGVYLEDFGGTFRNCRFVDSGVSVSNGGIRMEENLFEGAGVSLGSFGPRYSIEEGVFIHNEFCNDGIGIRCVDSPSEISVVEKNRFVGNEIGIFAVTPFGGFRNLRNNVFCDNSQFGVFDEDSEYEMVITDARENYWGAANGPSSPDDVESPLTDPETGLPADGDGDAVSEGDAEGVSNVRFDPFLTSPPEDAGRTEG